MGNTIVANCGKPSNTFKRIAKESDRWLVKVNPLNNTIGNIGVAVENLAAYKAKNWKLKILHRHF